MFACLVLVALVVESSRAKEDFSTKELLDRLYQGVSGFAIPESETSAIKQAGGRSTYGEIVYDSLATVLQDLRVAKHDVFYDLGSGVGKVVVQAYLDFPFKKSVGIELSDDRHSKAANIRDQLNKRKLIKTDRSLEFIRGDIAKADISDATVIYMCSTCYPAELMQTLLERLADLEKGLRVITLKSFPDSFARYGFTKTKKYTLPTTWSKGSSVHVYTLKRKNK